MESGFDSRTDNDAMKISFLFLATFVYLLPSTIMCLEDVPQDLIDTGKSIGMRSHEIISEILLPAALYRVSEKDKQGEPKLNGNGWRVKPIKDDVLIDILKDRMLGFEGRSVGVYYDQPSRRFFTNEVDLDRRYSWDKHKHTGGLPFPPEQLNDEEDEVFGSIQDGGGYSG